MYWPFKFIFTDSHYLIKQIRWGMDDTWIAWFFYSPIPDNIFKAPIICDGKLRQALFLHNVCLSEKLLMDLISRRFDRGPSIFSTATPKSLWAIMHLIHFTQTSYHQDIQNGAVEVILIICLNTNFHIFLRSKWFALTSFHLRKLNLQPAWEKLRNGRIRQWNIGVFN